MHQFSAPKAATARFAGIFSEHGISATVGMFDAIPFKQIREEYITE